jgi:tetratricopeptide (TPR) repeat protein
LKFIELYGDRPDMRKKRTHVLAKTVAISVKLGEHYSNPLVWKRDEALEQTMWAVETVENEKKRRKENNITVGDEGEWISDDEQGAALEALAHQYEEKDLHFLSAPLFLQALSYKEAKDCHTVILMNNLATSLAQQNPRAARAAQTASAVGPVASRESLIENAKLWAQKALDIAAAIKPPERDEECDMGCAVAMHNLGEFAEMLGNKQEARQKYLEAVALSRAIGFQEGVENSSARLRELDGTG